MPIKWSDLRFANLDFEGNATDELTACLRHEDGDEIDVYGPDRGKVYTINWYRLDDKKEWDVVTEDGRNQTYQRLDLAQAACILHELTKDGGWTVIDKTKEIDPIDIDEETVI
jgi:hypothetical protein